MRYPPFGERHGGHCVARHRNGLSVAPRGHSSVIVAAIRRERGEGDACGS